MNSLLKAYQMNVALTAGVPSGKADILSSKDMLTTLKEKLSILFMFKLRLVPLVIFFAVLVLGARVTTLFTHMGEKDLFKKAHASEIKNNKNKMIGELDALPVKEEKGKKSLEALDEFDPFNMTADQYRALNGILQKKDQLSDRERSISEKEQVLQALIKKMDEKIVELNQTKVELQKLIGKIDEEENANTKRLVKMTEAMKAPQAAKVLEGIEFPILLEIMETMREKKASAILAAMEVEKAGYLMTAMSKRRKIFKKNNPSKSIMKG